VDSLLKSHPDSALLQLRTMSFSSEADRMYHTLLLADAANKCYDTLPSDSLLREVAEFYDRHGTSNEQVRAHYLLGCAYRDLGEAPQALDCFHDAIDRADTLAADCDFYTLSRVHSQMAALLGEQMLPRQQLEELQQQYYYAFRIQDTLCVLNAMGQMTNAYNMLEQTDSAALIAKNLVEIYTKPKFRSTLV
jgi:tetratricopeptide (TPR) repeat protein